MPVCPCGQPIEEGQDYLDFELTPGDEGMKPGFVCIHGVVIFYGE